jgi:hypothetical protein
VNVPNWYELLLLGLAAYRTWYLIGMDTILDKPRAWVVGKGGEYVETMLECPYCAGTYVSLAWWGAWQLWPHGTLVVAGVVAIMAIIPLVERILSDD